MKTGFHPSGHSPACRCAADFTYEPCLHPSSPPTQYPKLLDSSPPPTPNAKLPFYPSPPSTPNPKMRITDMRISEMRTFEMRILEMRILR